MRGNNLTATATIPNQWGGGGATTLSYLPSLAHAATPTPRLDQNPFFGQEQLHQQLLLQQQLLATQHYQLHYQQQQQQQQPPLLHLNTSQFPPKFPASTAPQSALPSMQLPPISQMTSPAVTAPSVFVYPTPLGPGYLPPILGPRSTLSSPTPSSPPTSARHPAVPGLPPFSKTEGTISPTHTPSSTSSPPPFTNHTLSTTSPSHKAEKKKGGSEPRSSSLGKDEESVDGQDDGDDDEIIEDEEGDDDDDTKDGDYNDDEDDRELSQQDDDERDKDYQEGKSGPATRRRVSSASQGNKVTNSNLQGRPKGPAEDKGIPTDEATLLQMIAMGGKGVVRCGKKGKGPDDSQLLGEGEKIHVCKVPGCKTRFLRPEHLKRHMRTHTGEKPYACPVCGKLFTRIDNMKHHQLIHAKSKKNKSKLKQLQALEQASGKHPQGLAVPTFYPGTSASSAEAAAAALIAARQGVPFP